MLPTTIMLGYSMLHKLPMVQAADDFSTVSKLQAPTDYASILTDLNSHVPRRQHLWPIDHIQSYRKFVPRAGPRPFKPLTRCCGKLKR